MLLPPVFHFVDDGLSREPGWRRVALLPAQIEITIFSFPNGQIFWGPWLNCMLENTIKKNMAMGKHWWSEAEANIHQGPEPHRSQRIKPFSLWCSTGIGRPKQSNCKVLINKHRIFKLAEQTAPDAVSAQRTGRPRSSTRCGGTDPQPPPGCPTLHTPTQAPACSAEKQRRQSSILKRPGSLMQMNGCLSCVKDFCECLRCQVFRTGTLLRTNEMPIVRHKLHLRSVLWESH